MLMLGVMLVEENWLRFLNNLDNPFFINCPLAHSRHIRKLPQGEKVYFLIKAPVRKIAGHGFYKSFEDLTLEQAWKKWGRANGYPDKLTFSIEMGIDEACFETALLGNIQFDRCSFYPEETWFTPENADLEIPPELGLIKYFNRDVILVDGPRRTHSQKLMFSAVDPRKRTPQKTGRDNFTNSVFRAYNGKCAVTGETHPGILKAVYIQPRVNEDSDHVQNGILLRRDFAALFEDGLISIDPQGKLLVSPFLKSTMYEPWADSWLSLPRDNLESPSPSALDFHWKYVFRS
ncbi:HNH endonuclease [Myxococcota bacterium]|nr:HNH endonuclease [Myxococcota bacterium]MBU1382819.1 HNH endonuclease [Myxococcota bacterium]MBU1496663.1 HNH endonuclease [Myxococcota bacterium]